MCRTSLASKVSPVIRAFLLHDDIILSSDEVRHAKILWSYLIQRAHFKGEIELLKTNQTLPRSHALRNLFPVYKDGVIRVGGRLKHSVLSPDEKYPITLPSASILTDLVIRYSHHLTLHGGSQLCLALIRRLFWVVKGSVKVKAFIRNCVTCRRFQASPERQLMGDLPAKRVQPARPFANSGVDYAGPICSKLLAIGGISLIKAISPFSFVCALKPSI